MELQYCTFTLDKLTFALHVREVQEVLRFQSMTRVPLAPHAVEGLINLRGQIVTAVNLRQFFGLPDFLNRRPMNVVIRSEEDPVSLLVDSIGEVLQLNPDLFEPPPETMSPFLRKLTSQVYKLKDRLLLILDIRKVLDAASIRALG